MRWVVVDASWLAYRAEYSTGNLEHDGEPTGVIFGFLESIRALSLDPRIQSNRFAIFFDSKRSFRREQFPWYKQKRHDDKTAEEWEVHKQMKAQVERLRSEILPDIGFPCYRQIGVESDDLMAEAVSKTPFEDFVIVTADHDLFQCIKSNVHWYDPSRQTYYNQGSFWEKHGIHAEDWWRVKCLAGCKSDTVPGIKGVGEDSAVKYFNNELKVGSKRYLDIQSDEGTAVYERNEGIIRLPHAKTKVVSLVEPKYDMDQFVRWCGKLGMKSFLTPERTAQWEAFFSGKLAVKVESKQKSRKLGVEI